MKKKIVIAVIVVAIIIIYTATLGGSDFENAVLTQNDASEVLELDGQKQNILTDSSIVGWYISDLDLSRGFVISPDGKSIVFSLIRTDITENAILGSSNIYIYKLGSPKAVLIYSDLAKEEYTLEPISWGNDGIKLSKISTGLQKSVGEIVIDQQGKVLPNN